MKFSRSWIPLQNNSTFNVTQSEGLTMPCAKFTMMGFTTNLVLTPNYSATCKVMNKLVILNPKDNTWICYSLYITILINWRLHFCGPLFQPRNPLGEFCCLRKCNHLPKVSWVVCRGNLSPSLCDYQSWSTWPSRDPTLPSYNLVICSTISP